MNWLLHVALPRDLDASLESGLYRAASLERDGFLHCCDPAQLPGVLERWFSSGDALVLLLIDEAALPVVPVREPAGGDAFPHLYAPLPLATVRHRLPFVSPSSPRRDA